MLAPELIDTLRRYALAVERRGIPVNMLVLFGSQAGQTANDDSDIDVVVVSARFDTERTRALQVILWQAAAEVDARIEPIPCGQQEWLNPDGSRPILASIQYENNYICVDAAA